MSCCEEEKETKTSNNWGLFHPQDILIVSWYIIILPIPDWTITNCRCHAPSEAAADGESPPVTTIPSIIPNFESFVLQAQPSASGPIKQSVLGLYALTGREGATNVLGHGFLLFVVAVAWPDVVVVGGGAVAWVQAPWWLSLSIWHGVGVVGWSLVVGDWEGFGLALCNLE